MRPLLPVVLAALAGCPALTAHDLSERLDQDDDGFENAELGGTDCNDLDPTINPDAVERCDGVDNDCDHLFNEEDPSLADADWYLDADHDGFGRSEVHERTCQDLGAVLAEGGTMPAWVHDDTDCDDTDATQHPGQEWDIDGDGDGWGKYIATRRLTQCLRPPGYVVRIADGAEEDCDDVDAANNPGHAEICDGQDNDCDGMEAGDPDLVGGRVFHEDADGDGYGVDQADAPVCADVVPLGRSPLGGDCDDTNAAINPDATEIWEDDVDQDCDGNRYDQDGDGQEREDRGGPDCDDLSPDRYAGAPDICDGRWNDCATRADWERRDEDAGVWFTHSDPALPAVDWTATLSGAGDVVVTQPGKLWFCGEGPWLGRVQMRDLFDLEIEGYGGSVLDAQGHGANILINPLVSLDGHATIRGMTLTGGASSCLDVFSSHILVEDVTFDDCVATNQATPDSGLGGGATLRAAGEVIIRGSTFRNGQARAGGGAYVAASEITIEDTLVEDNTADEEGGGLSLAPAQPNDKAIATLSGVHVRTNHAGLRGDGLLTRNVAVELLDSDLADNDEMGWVALGGVDHVIERSQIVGHGDVGVYLAMGPTGRTDCAAAGTAQDHARIADNAVGVRLVSGIFEASPFCAFPPVTYANVVDVQLPNGGGDYTMPTGQATTCVATGACN